MHCGDSHRDRRFLPPIHERGRFVHTPFTNQFDSRIRSAASPPFGASVERMVRFSLGMTGAQNPSPTFITGIQREH